MIAWRKDANELIRKRAQLQQQALPQIDKLVVERQGTQWLVLFIASLGNSLIVFLLLASIGWRFFPSHAAQAAVQSLVTAVFGIFVLRFLYRQSSSLTGRFKSHSTK